MEEIGNHFKLEKLDGNKFHQTDLFFSSGRNCLRFIISKRNIKKILIPYFLCETVSESAINEGIEIEYYHIDNNYKPIDMPTNMNSGTFLYLVNYYGILTGEPIIDIVDKYKNVIVDNTHNFYDDNKYGVDTIFNYRKYFGVPDGACIISNLQYDPQLPKSKSLNRIVEFIEREESGKYFHYSTFMEADQYFHNEPISYISQFSDNYLKVINYGNCFTKRLTNYEYLNEKLSKYNLLNISDNIKLNFMYPFLVDDGIGLRKYLLENNIYANLFWPNVYNNGSNNFEISLAENTVLLPIDQRYGLDEMKYISNKILEYNSKTKKLCRRGK